jgi:hypothetical protein
MEASKMTPRKISSVALVTIAMSVGVSAGALPVYAATHHHHKRHQHHISTAIPQHNGGDRDADNNGGPSDGDGNV